MRLFPILALCLAIASPAKAVDFTKAEDVKGILELTKANWVGVREWDGEDLIYFTHLITYRCAIEQIRYFVNVGKPRIREMEECYYDLPQPFIIQAPDGYQVFDKHPLKSVDNVTVEITLKDGTLLKETFERKAIFIP